MTRVQCYDPPPSPIDARVNIRWMIRHDLPACEAIEFAGFPEAWEADDFLARLRRRDCIGVVAASVRDGGVLGYAIYTLHQTYMTLDRLAVAPRARQCGIGRALLARLQHKAATHRRDRIELAVAEENLPAQKWLRACGWRAVGIGPDGVEFVWESPVEGFQ